MSFFSTIAAFSRERHSIKTQAARLSWRCVGFRLNIPSRAYPDAPPTDPCTRSRPLASRSVAPAPDALGTRGGSNSNGSASQEKSRHPSAPLRGTWVTRPEATQAQVRPRAISRRGISREALSERDSRRARPSATFRACGVARGAQISVHAKDRSGVGTPFCFRSARASETRARLSLPSDHTTDDRATDRRD